MNHCEMLVGASLDSCSPTTHDIGIGSIQIKVEGTEQQILSLKYHTVR